MLKKILLITTSLINIAYAENFDKETKYLLITKFKPAYGYPVSPDVNIVTENSIISDMLVGNLDSKNKKEFGVYETPLNNELILKIKKMKSIFENYKNEKYLNDENNYQNSSSFIEFENGLTRAC